MVRHMDRSAWTLRVHRSIYNVFVSADILRQEANLTNEETKRFLFTCAYTSRQHILHIDAFLDLHPTWLLPVDDRPQVRSKVSLVKDIVCHIREPVQVGAGRARSKFDTLADGLRADAVAVYISEPQCRRDVFCYSI